MSQSYFSFHNEGTTRFQILYLGEVEWILTLDPRLEREALRPRGLRCPVSAGPNIGFCLPLAVLDGGFNKDVNEEMSIFGDFGLDILKTSLYLVWRDHFWLVLEPANERLRD